MLLRVVGAAALLLQLAAVWTAAAHAAHPETMLVHPVAGAAPLVVSDGGIATALTPQAGDSIRGRALVANRQLSMCLLCHQAPIAEARFQGDVSTSLAGVGLRWTAAQLRLRLVNPRLLTPDSVMPAYYRVEGLKRVSGGWRDKPLLDAQQIEDIIAWLQTLQ
jgi:sulfur-oxidizing protein SoxX